MNWRSHRGDCLDVLRTLAPASLDSLVTDPPAGIAFMGKAWDKDKGGRAGWVAWMTEIMRECLRVLKPGAHGLVWAIPRTSHWTATALEDAGFEIRDVVTHLFGTGFPKSLDVSKAIDKAAGAEREAIELKTDSINPTAPATDAAKQWQGFGTALKPASEHWILVRKPCSEKTVAANVLRWGTGAINVDGCRIAGTIPQVPQPKIPGGDMLGRDKVYEGRNGELSRAEGRFPANLVLDEEAAAMLDEQSGECKSGGASTGRGFQDDFVGGKVVNEVDQSYAKDKGTGASRFFYVAKASKSDRGENNRGFSGFVFSR